MDSKSKLILQNVQNFSEMSEFDPAAGSMKPFSKPKANFGNQGLYGEVEGQSVLLYVLQGRLFFKHNDTIIEIDSGVSSSNESIQSGRRIFKLAAGSQIIIEIEYQQEPFEEDFSMAEAEHFDILLLFTNILCSPTRRGVLLERAENFRLNDDSTRGQ